MDTVVIEFEAADFKRETVNGTSVRRFGKIFEAGDYPDKQFSLTADEAAKAVLNFRPVPINLSHTPTVLDGKLGQLAEVAFHSDGKTILGGASLPKWFDDLLDDDTRKVSCEWDRNEKRVVGLAVTPNPRVNDAVLMAAFSKTEEPPKETLEMPVELNEQEQGWFKTMLSKFGKEEEPPKEKPAPKAEPQESADAKFYREQFEASLRTRSAAFADELIKEGRLAPADKPKFSALHADLARADLSQKATFSENGTTTDFSRVELFETLCKGAKPDANVSMFQRESVNTADKKVVVLFDGGETEIESSGDRAAKKARANAGLKD